VAAAVSIPVFGNGDCVEPADLLERVRSTGVAGVLVGRGVLRNPWIFAQADALAAGRSLPPVSLAERGRFLLEYMDLLLRGDAGEAAGFRHRAGMVADGAVAASHAGADRSSGQQRGSLVTGHWSLRTDLPATPARGRDRWVINKIRALCAWYTRGFENGSHLRQAVNQTDSLAALRATLQAFFGC
jgi:tRNA-dihydrouridine synthase